MAGFEERWPAIVSPNPDGPDDPLGESVLDETQPWLRVFEPAQRRIVIGRHQDPEREIRWQLALADGVPVHRRCSGGGAVVLAPGMVVVAVRLTRPTHVLDRAAEAVNQALTQAITAIIACRVVTAGLGDLAIPDEAGVPRKILGSSLRQTRDRIVYLGVLLVADATDLFDRYLIHPSREPGYRAGRDHRAFCTYLSRHGADCGRLIPSILAQCRIRLSA